MLDPVGFPENLLHLLVTYVCWFSELHQFVIVIPFVILSITSHQARREPRLCLIKFWHTWQTGEHPQERGNKSWLKSSHHNSAEPQVNRSPPSSSPELVFIIMVIPIYLWRSQEEGMNITHSLPEKVSSILQSKRVSDDHTFDPLLLWSDTSSLKLIAVPSNVRCVCLSCRNDVLDATCPTNLEWTHYNRRRMWYS